MYGKIREYFKQVFHELTCQWNCEIAEGYMAGDHVHMCIVIPLKYAVLEIIVGFLKDKSSIAVAWQFGIVDGILVMNVFGIVVHVVTIIGFELDKIRGYIRHQEHQE